MDKIMLNKCPACGAGPCQAYGSRLEILRLMTWRVPRGADAECMGPIRSCVRCARCEHEVQVIGGADRAVAAWNGTLGSPKIPH